MKIKNSWLNKHERLLSIIFSFPSILSFRFYSTFSSPFTSLSFGPFVCWEAFEEGWVLLFEPLQIFVIRNVDGHFTIDKIVLKSLPLPYGVLEVLNNSAIYLLKLVMRILKNGIIRLKGFIKSLVYLLGCFLKPHLFNDLINCQA